MEPDFRNHCLKYIAEQWQGLRPVELRGEPVAQPPWGVWIREYDDLAPGTTAIADGEQAIQFAWFLSKTELEARDPHEYARFILANSYPLPRDNRENHIFGRVHKIALAAFAGYSGMPGIVYVECIWGTLWGEGLRLEFGNDGQVSSKENLWRS